MPTVYVMYGLPRAGKSTWVEQNRKNKLVISADNIRAMVHAQDHIPQLEYIIWKLFDESYKVLLKEGQDLKRDIIVDNTNTNPYMRKQAIRPAIKAGYDIVVMKLNTPLNICVKRAKENGQHRLVSKIFEMAKLAKEPLKVEGINEIVELDWKEQLIR